MLRVPPAVAPTVEARAVAAPPPTTTHADWWLWWWWCVVVVATAAGCRRAPERVHEYGSRSRRHQAARPGAWYAVRVGRATRWWLTYWLCLRKHGFERLCKSVFPRHHSRRRILGRLAVCEPLSPAPPAVQPLPHAGARRCCCVQLPVRPPPSPSLVHSDAFPKPTHTGQHHTPPRGVVHRAIALRARVPTLPASHPPIRAGIHTVCVCVCVAGKRPGVAGLPAHHLLSLRTASARYRAERVCRTSY